MSTVLIIATFLAFSIPPISGEQPEPCLRIAAAAPTATAPWVQIVNECEKTVDLADHVLRWSDEFDYSRGADWLSGQLEPGECTVVKQFTPALWHNASCAIGLALFDPLVDVFTSEPSDSVTYGEGNCGDLDWAGPWSDIDQPSPAEHIELTAEGWDVVPGTAVPNCTAGLPDPWWSIPPADCLLAVEDGNMCETHPLGPAIACGPEDEPQTVGKCQKVLEQNGNQLCSSDYVDCREAMRLAPCGVCPRECATVHGACDFV